MGTCTHAHRHTHIYAHTEQKRIFISWSSHRSYLSSASAALSFRPITLSPSHLGGWALRESRGSLWAGGRITIATWHWAAPKGLSHAWLLDLAQIKHMSVFLMVHQLWLWTPSIPTSPGSPILLAFILLWTEFFFFSTRLEELSIYMFQTISQPSPKYCWRPPTFVIQGSWKELPLNKYVTQKMLKEKELHF